MSGEAAVGFILQPTSRLERGRPVIQLFGRLDGGEPFLVEDDRFRPYFFVRSEHTPYLARQPDVEIAESALRDLQGHAVARVTVPVPGLAETNPNYFEFRRGKGEGRLYYTLHLNTAVDASRVSAINQGIHVERAYYDAACDPESMLCEPIDRIQAGQQVRVVVTIQTENDLLYPIIEDPIPAGGEAVDPNLDTTPSAGGEVPTPVDNRYGYWGWWYFNRVEYRDDKVVFLADFLPAGTYQYTYFLDTIIPGAFQVMPTFARQTYFPEVNGRADGMIFNITQ